MNAYSVKKVRLFDTPDGGGYNADLYRDGIKVASAFEAGLGGCVELHFISVDERVRFETFIATQTYVYDGETSTHSAETFISDLIGVVEDEIAKKKYEASIKRSCKKYIVVQYKGEQGHRIFKILPTENNIARVLAQYGEKIETVLNQNCAVQK